MKKPKPPTDDDCDYTRPNAPALRRALDGLAHFHVAHSDNRFADVFTKTVEPNAIGLAEGLTDRQVVVVLASDPAVVAALVEALKPYLPTLTIEMPEPPAPPKPSIQ